MKLLRLSIEGWRNFSTVSLEIPEDANLVCLIGENGTGKSNILELLSAVAHNFGLSRGNEPRRGTGPLADPHERIEVTLRLTTDPEPLLGEELWRDWQGINVSNWDGTLTFRSGTRKPEENGLFAGGPDFEDGGSLLGNRVAEWLRQFTEVRHAYLDADRSYPPRPVEPHELAEVFNDQWEAQNARADWAFRSTRTLYEQWARYIVGTWQKAANEHAKAEKAALDKGEPRPEFVDPLAAYGKSLETVLPHLRPRGVEDNALSFDSAGEPLIFDQLSGGEREIAFLVGQIDRFRLTRGLLFIDEPELHLNPDLLRVWLKFIVDGVLDGQVWISTHAMEAVEIAGTEATFVLERDPDTRVVARADPLTDRPTVAVLSQAVGSPAFSLGRLRFVYIEGEPPFTGEVDRFYDLCGDRTSNRFMAVGGGREVIKNVQAARGLSGAANEPLTVGGVLDRDFMTDDEATDKAGKASVFVLGCHEIENLFLHPKTLERVIQTTGVAATASALVLEKADKLAGMWVMRKAFARNSLDRSWLAPSAAVSQRANSLDWVQIHANETGTAQELAGLQEELSAEEVELLKADLESSIAAFGEIRETDDLWQLCMGKETLRQLPRSLGYATLSALVTAITRMWKEQTAPMPAEAVELREYVSNLEPVAV